MKGTSPTPFTPPTTEEDQIAWLRLIRSRRVGPGTFARLLAEHGSAAAALDALPGIAAAAGLDDYAPCPDDIARRELQNGRKLGAVPLFLGMPDYPALLATCTDAPPVLWALGHLPALTRPALAVVGARNASSLGLRMARKLAEALGTKGFVVVSGLARGIDAAAHGAALRSGTIAIMAGGVDHIYPTENAALGAALCETGLRLSEHPPGVSPQPRHFPQRNRIIAGLSRAVIVVEAAEGSGSLITARDALDQGREVLAVPGHPLDPRAAGCNALIRQGARLVRDIEDVIEALDPCAPDPAACDGAGPRPVNPSARTAPNPPAAAAAPAAAATRLPDTLTLHRMILDRLGPSPTAEDQLIRDLALPGHVIAPALLFLELDGRVHRQPGGLLARLH
jgi:DNA processing protein